VGNNAKRTTVFELAITSENYSHSNSNFPEGSRKTRIVELKWYVGKPLVTATKLEKNLINKPI